MQHQPTAVESVFDESTGLFFVFLFHAECPTCHKLANVLQVDQNLAAIVCTHCGGHHQTDKDYRTLIKTLKAKLAVK